MTSLRNDVITSRRPFWVESMLLCLLHVWCEFRDNVARNTDTVFQNRDFWPKIAIMTSLRHDVITSRRFFGVVTLLQVAIHVWCEFGDNRARNTDVVVQIPKKIKIPKKFSQISRERLDGFSIGKSRWKGLDVYYEFTPVRILIRVEIKELRSKKGEKIAFSSGHFEFATL